MIIVIIDACRDNPFEGKERGWGSVNLAPVFAPKGTLIAYSTSPGEKADDFGMDGHSVYTGALLKHLKCEFYAIPSTYLNLIYNDTPLRNLWIGRKFKRNFRNG